MSTISDDKVVSLHYTLKDDDGEVLEVVERDDPLLYLHGWDNIVPGLEEKLEGLEVGATCQVVVPPEDAYGEHHDVEPQAIPRSSLPDDMDMDPGLGFGVQDEDGQHMTLFVLRVDGDDVIVDINHPFAGKTLHYDVEVLAVRDATEEELQHGHPHGPEGHEGDEGDGSEGEHPPPA